MLQTKVTEVNRQNFYNSVYSIQNDSREQLINLEAFDSTCIIIDCCGAHYKTLFKNNIIVLETFTSAKEYKFSRDQFDKLIDNQTDNIKWPAVDVVNPVLIFDRSPMLKYLTIDNLCNHISSAAQTYQASKIIINHKLTFIDDLRITDRFYNWQNFKIKNYCVEKFLYSANNEEYFVQLKRILTFE